MRVLRTASALAVLVLAGCSAVSGPTTTPAPGESTTTTAAPIAAETTTTTVAEEGWHVVSVRAELPDGLSELLANLDGVDAISVVRVQNMRLVQTVDADETVVDRAPDEFFIPFEVHAVDPAAHAAYVPDPVADTLADLGPGEALLSESSAALRGLGPGAELVLDGGLTLAVVGVVPDAWVGAAEAAVTQATGESIGVERERYAIVRFDGATAELERSAGGLTEKPVHVRAREQVDVLRHADSVASQVAIKEMFGEFAYRPAEGDHIEIDPAWVEANIVEVELPLLGNDKCHRVFAAMLSEVMVELDRAGMGDAIDPSAYLGCWNPRFIRGRTDMSRHAWGAAADINFGNETDGGPGSPTHAALLEAMLDRHIRSGHAWTDPDPGHFEWYGPVGEG